MDIESTIRFLEQKWYTRWGLAVALVAAALLIVLIVPETALPWRVAAIAIAAAAIVVSWRLGWRPRKAKAGTVGLVISVACGTTAESRLMRDEFVATFRSLIKAGRTGSTFDVIEIPDHIAAGIQDIEQARALRVRTRSRFVLYGKVRIGQSDGKPAHFISLEGLVAHSPLPEDTQATFSNEFSQLLPRRVFVGMGNDLIGFEFLSVWTHVVAKYIVGMAAALSGEYDYAASLFEELQRQVLPAPSEPPALAWIRGRLPKRLAEVNTLRAAALHRRWVKSKSNEDLIALGRYTDAVPDQFVKQIGATNLKALWLFTGKRDASGALKLLEENRLEQDPAWLFNRAFLYAYTGNLRRAGQAYRKAEGIELNTDVLQQVEEFLYWLLGEEPDKVQILYCLGVITWRIRGDLVAAEKEFSEFLTKCPTHQFVKDREVVEGWLFDIRAALAGRGESTEERGS